MITIDIGKNDKVVSTFENPFTGEAMTLTVREWTLEDLIAVRNLTCNGISSEYHERRKLEDEERKLIQKMNFRDFQTEEEGTRHAKLKQMEATIKQMYASETLHTTMRVGIEGAIRYAVAQRFNEVMETVLPKYTGKKCGPKTYEKFVNEAVEAIGVKGLRFCISHSHVDFYGASVGQNCGVYERDPLTDSDNRFNAEYKLHKVKDSFDGLYPDDWSEWAQMVVDANEQIQSAFDDYVRRQDKLVNMLKIGDVGMKRVYTYDLKERR